MNLNNLCVLCTKAFEENISFNVTKGSNYEKELEIIDIIKKHNDILGERNKMKEYLFNHIEELDILLNMGAFKYPVLDEISVIAGTETYDLLSKFDIEDFDLIKNLNRQDVYMLYLLMYLNRIRRNENFSANVNPWNSLMNNISGCETKTLCEYIVSNSTSQVKNLILIENFKFSYENIENILTALNRPAVLGLVRYISAYLTADLDVICSLTDEQAKRITNILCKFFITKVKSFENVSIDRVMRDVINFLQLTNCNIQYLTGFVKNVEESFFNNEVSEFGYYNVALGNKYAKLVLMCPNANYRKTFLYALLNRKFAFLDMVQDNMEKFCETVERYSTSLLNVENIYSTVLNLNEVDKKSFEKLITISNGANRCFIKDENGNFIRLTPREVITLSQCENLSNVPLLYAKLDTKIDTKLLILRQIENMKYDFSVVNVDNLAKKLVAANIKQRMEKLGYSVNMELMLNILSLDDTYDALINAATSETELSFIWRNRETIDLTLSLADNLNNFIENDADCKKMFEIMELSDDFVKKNYETIKDFCLKGNATICCTYYRRRDIPTKQKTSMLRIAKAEMAGIMDVYKFFNISKEIEYSLSDKEISLWKDNVTGKKDKLFAYETYSFNDTMLVGEKPGHTCMNYRDGGYAECLLANFDSNKKLFFIKKGDLIVGRAIIRLTKSTNTVVKKNSLSFVDVERDMLIEDDNNERNEVLTIFLERFYSQHLSSTEITMAKRLLVDIVSKKAENMGAIFVAGRDYGDCGLVAKKCNVFVSHTKNEYQYMDSFSGMMDRSSEGGYYNYEFLVKE